MRLSRARQGVFLGAISALSVLAQTGISIGVKGGVPLADAFADRTFNYDVAVRNPFASPIASPIGEIPQAIRVYSGPRSFLLGPTIEFRFSFALGLEADALYRPMELQTRQTTSLADFLLGSAIGPFTSGLDTWEFPILAKYRISLPALQPYLEAGPAFRAISASLAEHMSGTGIAAGFGAEARIGRLRLSPEIRYTHWGSDRNYNTPYHAVSYQNQVEFLTGLPTVPAMAGSSQRSGGGLWSHLSIGVKGGFPFTHAFMQDQFGKVTYHSIPCGDFSLTSSCSPTTTTVQTFWASRNYLVGPTLEIQLPHGISIEGDSCLCVSSACSTLYAFY